jgi:hypothetical protein
MKKNVTIALLALVSIMSLSFAYTQKVRADENLAMAERAEAVAREMTIQAELAAKQAQEQMMLAQEQAKRAEMARAEADMQRAAAVAAVEKARKAK